MKTRKDYLAGTISHADYYGQFVSEGTKEVVIRYIGLKRLNESVDEHMNDIDLYMWDTLPKEYDREAFSIADPYGMTQGAWVCIAKEAGRQIKKTTATL